MFHVIKLGGSLLSWPQLGRRFSEWLRCRPASGRVVLVGGGPWVELLRGMQAEAGWSDAQVHWLAIDAMSLTARIAASVLEDLRPQLAVINRIEQLSAAETADDSPAASNLSSLTVVDCAPFLREREPHLPGKKLPCGWHVTSDSIAARVAVLAGAEELVLLKSAALPYADWQQLAECGYVDRFFPQLVDQLARIRCVNLRSEPASESVCERGVWRISLEG